MSNAALVEFLKQNPLKLACAVVALASGLGIYLLNTRISDATLLLDQKTTEGARLELNVKNSAQLSAQLEELTAIAGKIQTRQISASQLATNLQYFYRMETDSGVEMIDLRQTSSGATAKGKVGVAFSISLKGEYPAVIGFLQRLENGQHFCRVMTASMQGGSANREGPISVNLAVELLGKP